ncbi:MAG: DUF3726 domain-containing protein [Pseudomonadota bacterium]|nr:DUF3726 domain-containing protein [Pseudomonadota bacterium]
MRVSLAEVETLVSKAASGARVAPGVSDLVAVASRWLRLYGLPGETVAARALTNWLEHRSVAVQALDNGVFGPKCENRKASAMFAGAALVDHEPLTNRGMVIQSPDEPLLLLAMVATAFESGTTMIAWRDPDSGLQGLRIEDSRYTIFARSIDRLQSPGQIGANLSCTADLDWETAPVLIDDRALSTRRETAYSKGVELDRSSISILDRWAAAALVPDSERSHDKGAGAGRIDSN